MRTIEHRGKQQRVRCATGRQSPTCFVLSGSLPQAAIKRWPDAYKSYKWDPLVSLYEQGHMNTVFLVGCRVRYTLTRRGVAGRADRLRVVACGVGMVGFWADLWSFGVPCQGCSTGFFFDPHATVAFWCGHRSISDFESKLLLIHSIHWWARPRVFFVMGWEGVAASAPHPDVWVPSSHTSVTWTPSDRARFGRAAKSPLHTTTYVSPLQPSGGD